MANRQLGRTVVIANPASHSGRGARAADHVSRFFDAYASITTTFCLARTTSPGEATALAADAAANGTDTVIALGGDGLIHEVVAGLMAHPADTRPTLGVIPMGSGNDFARTVHIAHNNPETALSDLLAGRMAALDVGIVISNVGKVTYFAETLSFGMDAAIALDTTRRRAVGTRQEGEALFASSALRIVSGGAVSMPMDLAFDDEGSQRFPGIMLAVQIGPTYGGGFRICPAASPIDGLLSVCHTVRRAPTPRLLALLGLARLGLHTRSNVLRLRDCRRLVVDFPEGEPPCQVDGEPLHGTHFQVGCMRGAVKVIVGPKAPWHPTGRNGSTAPELR